MHCDSLLHDDDDDDDDQIDIVLNVKCHEFLAIKNKEAIKRLKRQQSFVANSEARKGRAKKMKQKK